MQELGSAVAFVSHYTNVPIKVGGRTIYCNYSRHQQLSADAANRVLLVTFFNALHAQLGEVLMQFIRVDLVYTLFSAYGVVQKVVTMNKDAAASFCS
eukprot:TRINITY_DN77_c0_g1_i1.p2 TRINITY_DN77_c0_g1~~TRINITY_DN77_c0_g1_i1.p2  ORF type:complete len:104 (-),score=34.07 TRINITY_DN77_c0_g1_i1:601-891(-)